MAGEARCEATCPRCCASWCGAQPPLLSAPELRVIAQLCCELGAQLTTQWCCIAGSHIWWFTARQLEWLMGDEAPEEWQQAYCQPLFEPLSDNSKKIVFMHGDAHRCVAISSVQRSHHLVQSPLHEAAPQADNELWPGHATRQNLLVTGDGQLMFIDFEFSAANWALDDLSYMCGLPPALLDCLLPPTCPLPPSILPAPFACPYPCPPTPSPLLLHTRGPPTLLTTRGLSAFIRARHSFAGMICLLTCARLATSAD